MDGEPVELGDALELRVGPEVLGCQLPQAVGPGGVSSSFWLSLRWFGDWFRREDFEACTFMKVLLEMGPRHPLGRASIGYLDGIRTRLRALAEEAGLERSEDFARSFQLLLKGSVVSAAEGDFLAADSARRMAEWLIDHHRNPRRSGG